MTYVSTWCICYALEYKLLFVLNIQARDNNQQISQLCSGLFDPFSFGQSKCHSVRKSVTLQVFEV